MGRVNAGMRRLTHVASLGNLRDFVRAPERLLLTEEAEDALSEALAAAASLHAVAAARLRAVTRSWRLQHLVGHEKAEAKLKKEQATPHPPPPPAAAAAAPAPPPPPPPPPLTASACLAAAPRPCSRLRQEGDAWQKKRTWRLWQHIRALPSREVGAALLEQALAELLQPLLAEPQLVLQEALRRASLSNKRAPTQVAPAAASPADSAGGVQRADSATVSMLAAMGMEADRIAAEQRTSERAEASQPGSSAGAAPPPRKTSVVGAPPPPPRSLLPPPPAPPARLAPLTADHARDGRRTLPLLPAAHLPWPPAPPPPSLPPSSPPAGPIPKQPGLRASAMGKRIALPSGWPEGLAPLEVVETNTPSAVAAGAGAVLPAPLPRPKMEGVVAMLARQHLARPDDVRIAMLLDAHAIREVQAAARRLLARREARLLEQKKVMLGELKHAGPGVRAPPQGMPPPFARPATAAAAAAAKPAAAAASPPPQPVARQWEGATAEQVILSEQGEASGKPPASAAAPPPATPPPAQPASTPPVQTPGAASRGSLGKSAHAEPATPDRALEAAVERAVAVSAGKRRSTLSSAKHSIIQIGAWMRQSLMVKPPPPPPSLTMKHEMQQQLQQVSASVAEDGDEGGEGGGGGKRGVQFALQGDDAPARRGGSAAARRGGSAAVSETASRGGSASGRYGSASGARNSSRYGSASSSRSGSSRSGSGRADGEPGTPRPEKLEPGRGGLTPGYLLPVARELQFKQQIDEDAGIVTRAQRQRHACFRLLAIWEEAIEMQQQARSPPWPYGAAFCPPPSTHPAPLPSRGARPPFGRAAPRAPRTAASRPSTRPPSCAPSSEWRRGCSTPARRPPGRTCASPAPPPCGRRRTWASARAARCKCRPRPAAPPAPRPPPLPPRLRRRARRRRRASWGTERELRGSRDERIGSHLPETVYFLRSVLGSVWKRRKV